MNPLTRFLTTEIDLRPIQSLGRGFVALLGRRKARVQYNWRFIRICATFHFTATMLIGGFALISGLGRIDSDISASLAERIADVIAVVLISPLMPVFWMYGWNAFREWIFLYYASPVIILMLNSVLWGVCLNLLASQTWWRKSAPPAA